MYCEKRRHGKESDTWCTESHVRCALPCSKPVSISLYGEMTLFSFQW